jgi:hypothetical protein
VEVHDGRAVEFMLGEEHYRRSELSWGDAGNPTATVRLSMLGPVLAVDVEVRTPHLAFAPRDALNPYDNEHPDINGDGLQLYIDHADASGAWMLVPERVDDRVRVRTLFRRSGSDPTARWTATSTGYRIAISVDLPPRTPLMLSLDLLINLTLPDRARRSGQLVLSGARGEFVYLRGDRHDLRRRVRLVRTG